EHVAAERHFTAVDGGAVGEDLAGLDLLALVDGGTLVEAGAGVRAHELAQLVNVDAVLGVGLRVFLEVLRQGAVFGDNDAGGVHRGDDAVGVGHDHELGVAGDAFLDAGADIGRLGLEERHALALHVGTHERAVGVVVLKERDHAGGDRNHLLGRDVHVVHVGGVHFEELAVLTNGDLADEVALVVDLGVGLGDDLGLFLIGGEILDLVGDLAVFEDAVGGLDEA